MDSAPPPDKGPPFSANAIRDPSLLPLQVSCIVGSYVVTVIVLGTLLLTVGRRLRRRALAGASCPPKPAKGPFEMSPTSSPPMNDRKWYSPKHSRKASGSVKSPVIGSVASFDATTLETDKKRRQDELQKLYAAALAHDEILKNDATVSETELIDKKQPLRVTTTVGQSHDNASYGPSPATTISPMSPVRAIYPPDVELPHVPQTATSPIRAEYPGRTHISHQSSLRDNSGPRRGQSPVGISAALQDSSRKAKRAPMHINIADARPPLGRQWAGSPAINNDEQPLSARSDSVPSTPGTYTSRRRASAARERDSEIGMALPTPSPLTSRFHENNPYRQSSPTYPPTADRQALAQISSPRMLLDAAANTNAQIRSPGVVSGGGMLSPALPTGGLPQSPRSPFHSPPFSPPDPGSSAQQQQQQQQQQQRSAMGSTTTIGGALPLRHAGPLSPAQTRTTFLERRRDMLYPGLRSTREGGGGGGGGTAGLRSAATTNGGPPATPYSPYMPFTPLTPVTPRLVTRVERERVRREEGRRALTAEDAVQVDEEVWGS